MALAIAIAVVTLLVGVALGARLPRGQSPPSSVATWFKVSFDDAGIHVELHRPRLTSSTVRWADVERVCLKMEPRRSDGVHLWLKGSNQVVAIPLEAEGGEALLFELPRRGLLTYELIEQAMAIPEGSVWYPDAPPPR